jgi:hypothetical protein
MHPTMRVKKTLTTLLVLACGLVLDISQAQTSEEPLEEIIVSGEYAGPGMWRITHPDHPSTLLGEHGYLESLRKLGYEILAPG